MRLKTAVLSGFPFERTVLSQPEQDTGPLLTGTGSLDYVCGGCGDLLLAHVHFGEWGSYALQCPKCGAYSEATAAH